MASVAGRPLSQHGLCGSSSAEGAMRGVNCVFLLQGLLLMSVRLCSSRSLEHLPSPDIRAEDDREPRERNKELVKKKTLT